MNENVKPAEFKRVFNSREQIRDNTLVAGLEAFYNVCNRDPQNWIYTMVSHNGAVVCMQEYAKAGGFAVLKPSEIQEIEAGIVPEWAAKIMAEFERRHNIRL
ncbi:hypothetical protein [Stenotrophomonas phage YB07]|uniref:Uncharacterized protein n=1 Tax=Stenotrophomonas phage YB07 TaxID=2555548 RepID=A0A482IEF4_9CAUD|nr:hypothetical protein HWC11_gp051 [Stenotrophomonas phage YB07]QBP06247.1 hypothetical protein [Stenotrophomonas phage YB07]